MSPERSAIIAAMVLNGSRRNRRSILGGLLLSLLGGPAAAEPMTKVLVDRDGLFRVTDAALVKAGRRFATAEIPRLRLTVQEREVPIRISPLPPGSADGRFVVDFLGAFPRGQTTYEDEFTTANAYVLSVAPAGPGAAAPKRIQVQKAAALPPATPRLASPYTAHHEINRILVRFATVKKPDESWFWQEIKATDQKATEVTLSAKDVALRAEATLRVRLVGYSHLPENPDHSVEIQLNGKPIGKALFDGETAYTFEARLGPGELLDGENVLSLRALGETTAGVDLVLLDWVELTFPRLHRLETADQVTVEADAKAPVRVEGAGSGVVTFFDTESPRAVDVEPTNGVADFALPPAAALRAKPGGRGAATRKASVEAPQARTFRAVKAPYVPKQVVVSEPADLKAPGLGADFVIISHKRFLPAVEKLAAARRRQGLATQVVDVDDVYDRFAAGLFQPEAIRDFLKYAWSSWTPRPRYVLLVGDASWDYKNATVSDENYADWHWSTDWAREVPKNPLDPYRSPVDKNDRLFVPTYQFQSPWGHAASDNHFASLTTKDGRPDLAVGRLPVATLEEANAVVEKILAYDRLPEGDIRNAVFVTNDEVGFQMQTDVLAHDAAEEGYAVTKVYPKKNVDNKLSTDALIQAFDDGQAIVLFNGHGGRYIWRTAPPDLSKNRDLFSLEHLDKLKPNPALPVVISLTCYSAPFDHPVADSIGEKMLRLPHKGAIAVIASSWRNAPPLELGRKLVHVLGDPKFPRIGDAFLEAKRTTNDEVALYTYNLLGDPTSRYRGIQPKPLKELIPFNTGSIVLQGDAETNAGGTP